MNSKSRQIVRVFVLCLAVSIFIICSTSSPRRAESCKPEDPIGSDQVLLLGRIIINLNNYQGHNEKISSALTVTIVECADDEEHTILKKHTVITNAQGYYFLANLQRDKWYGPAEIIYPNGTLKLPFSLLVGKFEKDERAVALPLELTVNSSGEIMSHEIFQVGLEVEIFQWFKSKYPNSGWIPAIDQALKKYQN